MNLASKLRSLSIDVERLEEEVAREEENHARIDALTEEVEQLRRGRAVVRDFIEATRDLAGSHVLTEIECLEWLREQARRRAA